MVTTACLVALLGLLANETPVPATADSVAVLDGFERPDWPDPVLWPVVDGWRPSACQARRGQQALRAFAPALPDEPQPACNAAVAAGATSRAQLLLDLRGAQAANRLELHFDLWLRLNAASVEAPSGLFLYLLVPEADAAGGSAGAAQRVGIFGATGDAGRWSFPGRALDLRNLVDIADPSTVYDLRGKRWWLEWVAVAPSGGPPGGGVYLDDLALVWEPDAVVPTPTPRPLPPPSATPTASNTRPPTPTATWTPSPTREPTAPPPAVLYLPLVRRDPSPTPRPSATPDPLVTPSTGTPGSPTPQTSTPTSPSATPTPTASATATKVRRFLPYAQLERSMEAYPAPPSFPSPESKRSSRRWPVLEWPRFAPP